MAHTIWFCTLYSWAPSSSIHRFSSPRFETVKANVVEFSIHWQARNHTQRIYLHRIRGKFTAFCFVFICLSHFDTHNSQLLGYSLFGWENSLHVPDAWTCCLSDYGNMDNVFAVWIATLTMRATCYSTKVMQQKKKNIKSFALGLILNRYNAHYYYYLSSSKILSNRWHKLQTFHFRIL